MSNANEDGAPDGFMSAKDLRDYALNVEMARASKESEAAEKAQAKRRELIETLSKRVEVTPDMGKRLLSRLKTAAVNGATELEVMRFPVELCTDKGRAINNSEPDWPDTLTGRPRQAYEIWQQHLQPAGYRLKSFIVDWPHGLPGDVGLYLVWGDAKPH